MVKKLKEAPSHLHFETIWEVIRHFDEKTKEAEDVIGKYRSQIQELTGHDPNKPLTPLDVIKIVSKVFYQEPKP